MDRIDSISERNVPPAGFPAGAATSTAPQPPACRALLVDLDGTLYHPLPVKFAMAAELLLGHWSAIGVLRAFRQEHERLRTEAPVASGSSPYRLQMDRTARRLDCSPQRVEAIVTEWMHRRPGKWLWLFRRRRLLAAIAAFRAQGGWAAVVSDYPAAAKLAALRLTHGFDAVVASGETSSLARLKPSPEGYLAAASSIKVLPAECLVIGDRDDADGEAARRAGMPFMAVKTFVRSISCDAWPSPAARSGS